MTRINNFRDWKKVNEDISIVTLQIGIILGMLGWKGLKMLINKIAGKIGSKIELEKEELNHIVDDLIDELETKSKGDFSLTQLKSSLKSQIENGEITHTSDIIGYLKKFD